MKKILILVATLLISISAFSQKYAFIDTEYILNNIPSYKAAQDKLDAMSAEWQKEIEAKRAEIEKMYKEYQSEKVLLTEDMKQKREQEILKKEKEVRDLQNNYFGQQGQLFEKRKELIKPIQDELYAAVKDLAEKQGFAAIFDSSSGMTMIYTDPKFDKSDEVLKIMGYKN